MRQDLWLMTQSIEEILERGPATSKEIQSATGQNQSWVSRRLRELGDRIIRLKAGRTPRYALTRNAFGSDDRLPLYRVDPHGNNAIVASIRPLAHGGFWVEPSPGMPTLLLGQDGSGLYDDLPYFLDDLRPQGFLGRQIAIELSGIPPGFPSNPEIWSTDQLGRYLISNGDDLPGNFKLGEQAILRRRSKPHPVDVHDYPKLADDVMAGTIPGSSAGGEQPKFTAYHRERGHVIVKFSPKEESPVSRRWRDILITEYHAAAAIQKMNIPAAETRLFEEGGRLFLESQRFDRNGEFGRLPLISLRAVDAEFVGNGSSWPKVMMGLYAMKLVNYQDAYDAIFLWCFGRLIKNTDMHLGNLSLSIDGNFFRILPVYDMCSMGFAPSVGDVPPFHFSIPDIRMETKELMEIDFKPVCKMASNFWEEVGSDDRISNEFRQFIQDAQLTSGMMDIGSRST
jgi:hypothetical protein